MSACGWWRASHSVSPLPSLFTFYLCFSSPAEPLWQHQKWAFQNPRGWWERSDAHVLQSWQRRLAFKARYVHRGWLFKIGEWCRRLISEKCKQLQSVASKMWLSEHDCKTIYKTFDMLMIDEDITASLALSLHVLMCSFSTTLYINIRCQKVFSLHLHYWFWTPGLSSAEATLFLLDVCCSFSNFCIRKETEGFWNIRSVTSIQSFHIYIISPL